jgi:hypothetical protein
MIDEAEIARTESLFRHVNERIAETAERFESPEASFVCECSDRDCADRVEAPLAEYERIREEPTRFLLAPGHEERPVERPVGGGPGYRIVEKLGLAGVVARQLDPRAQTA